MFKRYPIKGQHNLQTRLVQRRIDESVFFASVDVISERFELKLVAFRRCTLLTTHSAAENNGKTNTQSHRPILHSRTQFWIQTTFTKYVTVTMLINGGNLLVLGTSTSTYSQSPQFHYFWNCQPELSTPISLRSIFVTRTKT